METESKAENDLQPLSPHSSESVKGSTCDTSQVEDDIVLATSSQGNYITVQNPRGSTTVVKVLVRMNTILQIQVQMILLKTNLL